MVARRARLLGPAYRLFYEEPVHIVRGEGVWLLRRRRRRRYLDAYNNVASVGHCHPRVVAAIGAAGGGPQHPHPLSDRRRSSTMPSGCSRPFPPELGHVMFTCTGSEANDLALRIARAGTGGTGVIVTQNAYHGVTDRRRRALALARRRPSARRASDGARRRTRGDRRRRRALRRGRRRPRSPTCGAPASRPPPCSSTPSSPATASSPIRAGFLAPAVAAMRAAGGLFIADEVQPGFGRTGARMWGFARHGVVPDIVTMGKPMGNGHPIAGVGRAARRWSRPSADEVALLQHLRRQPGLLRRRPGGARRDRGARASSPTPPRSARR